MPSINRDVFHLPKGMALDSLFFFAPVACSYVRKIFLKEGLWAGS